jgi:hypothetical protein
MKTLEQILEETNYTYDNCPTVNNFEKEIQAKMPDYKVMAFDMDDEYSAVGDTLAMEIIGKFVEDMQVQMWNGDDETVYYYVVAIKIKETDSKDKIIKNLTDEVFDLKQTINKLSNQIIEMQNKGN